VGGNDKVVHREEDYIQLFWPRLERYLAELRLQV
jgi:hypothetical protein